MFALQGIRLYTSDDFLTWICAGPWGWIAAIFPKIRLAIVKSGGWMIGTSWLQIVNLKVKTHNASTLNNLKIFELESFKRCQNVTNEIVEIPYLNLRSELLQNYSFVTQQPFLNIPISTIYFTTVLIISKLPLQLITRDENIHLNEGV